MTQNSNKIMYQDKTVIVDDVQVKVLDFYFPQDCKNSIRFKDINKIGLKQMDEMDQTLGVDPKVFESFLKKVKQGKNLYIQVAVQDQSLVLSFAPDQPQQVYNLIRQKWQKQKISEQSQFKAGSQSSNLYGNMLIPQQSIQKALKYLNNPSEKQNYPPINQMNYKITQEGQVNQGGMFKIPVLGRDDQITGFEAIEGTHVVSLENVEVEKALNDQS